MTESTDRCYGVENGEYDDEEVNSGTQHD